MKKITLILILLVCVLAGCQKEEAAGRNRYRYGPDITALAYYAVDTASNDTYVASIRGLNAYFTGMCVLLNPVTANTDGATLNINGFGAKAIEGEDGAALTTNDILATGIYLMSYDGTNFLVHE